MVQNWPRWPNKLQNCLQSAGRSSPPTGSARTKTQKRRGRLGTTPRPSPRRKPSRPFNKNIICVEPHLVALLQFTRHGRERYFYVKAIFKSIIFPNKLSRQMLSQLCDWKFSSRQLSSQLFFQPIYQGNCQVNCVTPIFFQSNCQVNLLLKIILCLWSIFVILGQFGSIIVNYGQLYVI